MTNEAYEYFGCNTGDVIFIGVNSDTDDAGAIAWDNTNGVNYTTISSTSGGTAIFNAYNPAALPTLILIAPDQSIVEQDIWPISSSATIENLFENTYGLTPMACGTGNIKLPENKGDDVIFIYPNPAKDVIYLDGADHDYIEIFDVIGKKVAQVNKKENMLNVANFPEGVYVIKIHLDSNIESHKFIIER
jgi:hypothetical protein